MKRGMLLSVLLALAVASLRADAITETNAKACALVAAHSQAAPSRRVLAIVQVAAFEAVNAIAGRPRTSRLDLSAARDASAAAAVASATRVALLALIPSAATPIEAWYAEALAQVPDGLGKVEGIALGARAARGVLALKAGDGASEPETYRPQTSPGAYVPTVTPAVPHWPGRKPWHMKSADQFRPGPPPDLASSTWAQDFNESRALGGKVSAKRTPEQTAIGKFWEDNSSAIYFGVLQRVAEAPGRDLVANAWLYACAATGMDDATIAVMDAKYAYRFWRPLTAIRNGDQDGNDATEREAGWSPLIETPMHPEYPCAHCINGAVLAELLDAALPPGVPVALATTSLTAPGVVRTWTSTAAMVEEVGNARIWSGVHYRTSTRAGEAMGHELGRLVVEAWRR